jgi:hypothetical protein
MSTPFLDDNNREWRIHLTLGKVKEINDLLGLDLLAPWDGKAIDAVTKDIFQFARIMAMAVRFDEKADPVEQGEALADGLRGEGLDRAIIAFWRDLSGFFVGQQRTAFVTLISKALEMWDALWTQGTRQALTISAETLSLMSAETPPPPAAPTSPAPTGT